MWLLIAIAGITAAITGYCDGATGRRLLLALGVQPLLVALVIAAIADMDEPFRGTVSVSRKPLVRAEESMQ
jgi:ABC-type methionine transport system permease subunit